MTDVRQLNELAGRREFLHDTQIQIQLRKCRMTCYGSPDAATAVDSIT